MSSALHRALSYQNQPSVSSKFRRYCLSYRPWQYWQSEFLKPAQEISFYGTLAIGRQQAHGVHRIHTVHEVYVIPRPAITIPLPWRAGIVIVGSRWQAATDDRTLDAAMEVLLDAGQIERLIHDLAGEIAAQTPPRDLAIIGIRSRGEILAQRLANHLSQQLGQPVPCGTLDITLYRDDLNNPHGSGQPQVRTTEIGFDIDDKIIVLVDDVLYTGRSTRAAMDALIDLGRPKAIRLAVLVERTGRELPIQADYAGCSVDAGSQQSVQVNFIESDGKDEVTME
jgi:pyrimidine operon attenuation protein/uracil phosphoribosyltransferase